DIIKKIERARVKMEQIKPRSTLPRGKKEGGLTVKLFKGHYTSQPATAADITAKKNRRRNRPARNLLHPTLPNHARMHALAAGIILGE
ncbi:MAG: hypothetical protein ACREYE_12215, partial [Gammaproteobacteria bacterium]